METITNNTEKMQDILSSIGLSKNEIIIYLDLINYNPSSALEISRRTKIHRSNTYDSLRKLIEKGFILEIIRDDKKVFQAAEPIKIKDYIRQKELEFDTILPHLKIFNKINEEDSSVKISRGIFGARESLLDLLNHNKEILIIGASDEAVDMYGLGFLNDFHKQRIRKKINMRHISNKSAEERAKQLNKLKLTEAKCLSEKYDTIASTAICGDTVLFTIFGKPLFVISVNNKQIAESYRKYFEILWRVSKFP